MNDLEDPMKSAEVDEYRGAKENAWSWETRRKFLLHHYNRPEGLDVVNCYSWILINNKSLGCRYDAVHMEKVNRMAAEAGILVDLEKGGPTPKILPYAQANGRGRGKGRGNKENTSFQDGQLNGNGFYAGENLDSRQALDAQIATCLSSCSMENAGLDGSPVPASSFFTKDYVKPPVINPASFGGLSTNSPGRDVEALTPDEEVAQLTRSDGEEESDADNGVVLPSSLNTYGSCESDYFFDASMLSSELIAPELEYVEVERPPSHPEVLARSLSDAEDEIALNFKEEEDMLRAVESLVGPANDKAPPSSTVLSSDVSQGAFNKEESVGKIHISGSQLAQLTQKAPRNAFLAGLFSTVKKPDSPAQDTIYCRYNNNNSSQDPAFNDPAVVYASKPVSSIVPVKEKDLEDATRAIKEMLFLPGGANRKERVAQSVLPAFPVVSPVHRIESTSHPNKPAMRDHRHMFSVAQYKNCDPSVILIRQPSSSDYPSANIVQALSFLKSRPENEVVVRLRGDFVREEAFRILSETISINKAQRLIAMSTTQVAKRNGRPVQETKVCYAGKQISLGHHLVAKESKNAAAMECLNLLMQRFSTVKVSASENAFVQSISRGDLFSGAAVDAVLDKVEAESESHAPVKRSIGWILMEKMGWKEGKGLGKNENGPLHPLACNITASYAVYGRRGLGYRDADIDYRLILDRADTLFQCLIANAIVLDDLVFTNEFSPHEREVIHNAAEKYGLSHNSLGVGDGRHLVVRYKYTPRQLVEELRRVGGRTERYELLEPP